MVCVVHHLDGSHQTFGVSLDDIDTVAQLKRRIAEKLGVTAYDLRLRYGAAHLVDERTASFYGLSPYASLVVYPQLTARL